MVDQVDALTDLLYLTYGSFVLMGVDPKPFFDTVHEANMGKIFPDGKAHFDPVTHKILKPSDWEERFAPEPHIKRELDRQIQKSLQRSNKKRKRFGQSAPNLFLIKMTVIDSPTCGKIMSFYVFLRSLL